MDDVVIIRPSGKFALLRLLATIFATETVYAFCFVVLLLLQTGSVDRGYVIGLWLLHTAKFVLLIGFCTDIIIRYLSMHYYIARNHLIINRGIINNEEKVYELSQVRKLSVTQDSVGKRLNFGNVHLLLGEKGFEEEITLVNITNPRGITKEIERYLGTFRRESTGD
ncbi:MAG: PH domain-containing protein [Patescibacteria group bacterium]